MCAVSRKSIMIRLSITFSWYQYGPTENIYLFTYLFGCLFVFCLFIYLFIYLQASPKGLENSQSKLH